MNSLFSAALALGQASPSSIRVVACKIWPQTHPIRCILLCNVTLPRLLSRGRAHFPSAWVCADLVNCSKKWGRSNITWLPRLGLKRPGSFYPHSLRILSWEHHAEKKSRIKDHVERGPAVPARPVPSQTTNWIQLREWGQSTGQACRRSQPTESGEIRNHCFQPLDLWAILLPGAWNPPWPSLCRSLQPHLQIHPRWAQPLLGGTVLILSVHQNYLGNCKNSSAQVPPPETQI